VSNSRISILKDRASMLKKTRDFFFARHVLEVDCPLLSETAAVDAHIDLIEASPQLGAKRYLHSSPEYGMKRLLSIGIGDIYQLSHVFRDGELGHRHNPEFMMVEWYRVGMSFPDLIEETVMFIKVFLEDIHVHNLMSYKEAFLQYSGIDPFEATHEELTTKLQASLPDQPDLILMDRDDLLHQILALQIEPFLGKDELTVLAYYPPSQAALAKTQVVDGNVVALRFEVYNQGVELANGYFELQDPDEQAARFEEANRLRRKIGKNELPIDYRFLEALRQGLPSCSGVAVGFDRLMMLRHKKQQIKEVISFDWRNA